MTIRTFATLTFTRIVTRSKTRAETWSAHVGTNRLYLTRTRTSLFSGDSWSLEAWGRNHLRFGLGDTWAIWDDGDFDIVKRHKTCGDTQEADCWIASDPDILVAFWLKMHGR
jgi:hypothetical protein